MLIALLVVGAFYLHVLAATLGPRLPTSAVDQMNCPPDGVWTNPQNVELADGTPAIGSANGNDCGDTSDLYTTGFGFSVPPTAVINGITVQINRRAQDTASVGDFNVMLLSGGIQVGSNLAVGGNYSTATTTASYGGVSNLWGTTWTPTQINSSTFGSDYAISINTSGSHNTYVDFIQITVTYTLQTFHGSVTVNQSRTFIGNSITTIN